MWASVAQGVPVVINLSGKPDIVLAASFWLDPTVHQRHLKGTDLATKAPTATTELKYDGFSMMLHWLTAALVAMVWALGQFMDEFTKGAPRHAALSVHMVLGLLVGVVVLVRIAWRSAGGRRLPSVDEGWLNLLAKAVHYGLYLLLVLTVVFGAASAWVHGLSVFDWFTFPRPAFATRSVVRTVSELHSDLADLLVIVAGLHAAAALMHHYVRRDSVLRRMLPGKRAG